MNKRLFITAALTLLVTAACTAPGTSVDTQANDPTPEPLPTNTLILPADNNVPLYYSADEITKLSSCALRARYAEAIADEKLNGKSAEQIKATHLNDKSIPDGQMLIDQAFTNAFFSKNDFAMKIFNTCTAMNNMTNERSNRAAFCMSSQFGAEYIWNAKQQGISDKEVRHRLAESGNKTVPLITHEIYDHEAESLDETRIRLWDDCIHNFKQLK